MKEDRPLNCWICGKPANSREHMLKRSDLKASYEKIDQKHPIYFSNDNKRNIPIGSLNNHHFKFSKTLCAFCNNTRTQQHDKSWEILSDELHNIVSHNFSKNRFSAKSIFGAQSQTHLLNVHLYFTKLMGCAIVEKNIPADLICFSNAIIQNAAHQDLYLQFFYHDKQTHVGPSDVKARLNDQGEAVSLYWLYELEFFTIVIIYAKEEIARNMCNVWHPNSGIDRVKFRCLPSDFSNYLFYEHSCPYRTPESITSPNKTTALRAAIDPGSQASRKARDDGGWGLLRWEKPHDNILKEKFLRFLPLGTKNGANR